MLHISSVKPPILAIWLIILIAGLPRFAETVYAPSLPEISRAMGVAPAVAEYTLASYLFGFAMGVLFWGCISDRIGRKPSLILGFVIFIFACLGCYFSVTIHALIYARIVQGFGGSAGSIIAQIMCRDKFHNAELVRAFAAIGTALSLFPAIGPIIGGLIMANYQWPSIFFLLLICAIVLLAVILQKLPETLDKMSNNCAALNSISIWNVFSAIIRDKRTMLFCVISSFALAIGFVYTIESSFILIEYLGLSSDKYGMSFGAIALSAAAGGIYSRKMSNDGKRPERLIKSGIRNIIVAAAICSIIAIINCHMKLSNYIMIFATIITQMPIAFSLCMIYGNTIAIALADYHHAIGAASSIYNFLSYSIISFTAFIASTFHSSTLLSMPIFFLVIGILMHIAMILASRRERLSREIK